MDLNFRIKGKVSLLYIEGIKMAQEAVTSGPPDNDGGVILHAGVIASGRFTNIPQLTNVAGQLQYGSQVLGNEYNGVQSVQKSATTTIINITERSSTGKVQINATTHGLVVGDMVFVEGTVPTNYNVTHRVTEVIDDDNVATSVIYTIDDSTEGDFRTVSGSFAVMVTGRFIARYMSGGFVANVANDIMRSPASNYHRNHNHPIQTTRRLDETSWDYVSGVLTKGAAAGDLVTFIDPAVAGGATAARDSAAFPTYAIPGELVYMEGPLLPIQADYPPRTST